MRDERKLLIDYAQLFRPPRTSLEILDRAAEGKQTRIFPGEELSAADGTRNFIRHVLHKSYLPTAETAFVPFRTENGVFDVVRASYVRNSFRIEVAATLCVLSITVSPREGETTVCVERAKRLAAEVLRTTSPVQLIQVEEEGDMSFGKQGRAPVSEHSFWEDALHWWCTPMQVGFLTLATLGGPTRLAYSFSLESNRVWFELNERRKPPRPSKW